MLLGIDHLTQKLNENSVYFRVGLATDQQLAPYRNLAVSAISDKRNCLFDSAIEKYLQIFDMMRFVDVVYLSNISNVLLAKGDFVNAYYCLFKIVVYYEELKDIYRNEGLNASNANILAPLTDPDLSSLGNESLSRIVTMANVIKNFINNGDINTIKRFCITISGNPSYAPYIDRVKIYDQIAILKKANNIFNK